MLDLDMKLSGCVVVWLYVGPVRIPLKDLPVAPLVLLDRTVLGNPRPQPRVLQDPTVLREPALPPLAQPVVSVLLVLPQ